MLRSYSAYGKQVPYSPDTSSCGLFNVDGYAAGAGYLQIFDKAAVVNADVPLKSLTISGAGPLPSVSYENGLQIGTRLWFAMSSTRATYTALNTVYDVWGEIEDSTNVHQSVQQAGLLTEADTTTFALNPWLDAEGPKTLFSAQVVNNGAASLYLMLFTTDLQQPGDKPLRQWHVPAGETLDLDFGPNGFVPTSTETARGDSGVTTKGCYFHMSTLAGTLNAPVLEECDMTANYK